MDFLAQNRGVGLLTGEVGAGKSTVTRLFAASLRPNVFKVLYIHFATGSALDLLRQVALTFDLQPAHRRGDLLRQISATIQLNQNKKQHPVLLCDEGLLMPHAVLEQLRCCSTSTWILPATSRRCSSANRFWIAR
jgi:general secretion pathway protein A